jgi:hypothetical protein
MKAANVGEIEASPEPNAMKMAAMGKTIRGEKITKSLPASGLMAALVIIYEDVNHVAWSKASRPSATAP